MRRQTWAIENKTRNSSCKYHVSFSIIKISVLHLQLRNATFPDMPNTLKLGQGLDLESQSITFPDAEKREEPSGIF